MSVIYSLIFVLLFYLIASDNFEEESAQQATLMRIDIFIRKINDFLPSFVRWLEMMKKL